MRLLYLVCNYVQKSFFVAQESGTFHTNFPDK